MSHTTEISDIVITDIEALGLAVKELQAQGIKITLQKNATARAYYANQVGMAGTHDYVLKLEDAPYDVALVKRENGKGYTARTDLFAGHVARVLGAPAQEGENPQQAALGKFYQAYAVNAAARQGARQGYNVRRSVKPDGTVQLVMTVN